MDEKSVNRYHTLHARAKRSLVQRFAERPWREGERQRQRQRVTTELLPCGGAMATLHLFAIFSALTTTLLLCIPTSSCSCLNTGLYRKSSNLLLLLLLLLVVLLSPIASNCLEQNASIIRTMICKLPGLSLVK